jgi:Yip1-like protein
MQMVKNPWLRIWIQPRQTIKAIVSKDPKHCFKSLSAIYGFPLLLHFAQVLSLGETFTFGFILLCAIVLCTFIGMLGITITSGLLLWTGKWIGGQGSYMNIRSAVTWSNVTNVVTSLIWLILIATFGQRVFVSSFPSMPFMGAEAALVMVLFLVQLIVSIWSIVILCKALGEVQKFSSWKGLLNIIIPFILVLVFVWVVMLIIGPSVGMPQ